jgi:tetratricopeptide (TPR) repeat protein
MNMSKAALAAIFASGASMLACSVPVNAQVLDSLRQRQSRQNQQQAQQQQRGGCQLTAPEGQRQYQLGREECTAVAPLLQAALARDWAAARAAIPAAQAGARSADAKYLTAQAILHVGDGTNDLPLQAQAIDAIIASGGAQPSELPALYGNQIRLALAAGDTAKAQQAQARLDALNPNDPARFIRQAALLVQANNHAGAIPLYLQAIQAAGQTVPVEWRRDLAALAYQARDPNALRYFRDWLTAAPSPNSWHDTLAIFVEQGANSGVKLDAYRLMRGAGAMLGERDFVQYAEAANDARAYAEVAAVLQEGLSRNLITTNAAYARERIAQANQRVQAFRGIIAQERQSALAGNDAQHAIYVGDAHYGAGEYAQAAEMYRAALQKGADAGTVNTRIGAALAMAGQRAEAETALRAVSGNRAELAQLWLLWLSSRR